MKIASSDNQVSLEEMRAFLLKRGWTDDDLRKDFIEQDIAEIEKAHKQIQELDIQQEEERLILSRLPSTKVLLPSPELEKLLRYETGH